MNIQIRHAKPEDSVDLKELNSQPKAMAGTLQLPFPSDDLWRKRLEEGPEHGRLLVAECEGKVVGWLGLHWERNLRRRHAAGIGLAVHDDWHNKGIGTSLLHAAIEMADKWLNIHRLELTVFTDNKTAIRLYEKFGFYKEGELKDYAFRNGVFADVVYMARLKPDVNERV